MVVICVSSAYCFQALEVTSCLLLFRRFGLTASLVNRKSIRCKGATTILTLQKLSLGTLVCSVIHGIYIIGPLGCVDRNKKDLEKSQWHLNAFNKILTFVFQFI